MVVYVGLYVDAGAVKGFYSRGVLVFELQERGALQPTDLLVARCAKEPLRAGREKRPNSSVAVQC